MNEEWKKGFHNKLNDYETTPPQGLFDEILKHIPSFEEGEKAPNKPIEAPITTANTNKKEAGQGCYLAHCHSLCRCNSYDFVGKQFCCRCCEQHERNWQLSRKQQKCNRKQRWKDRNAIFRQRIHKQ